MLCLRKYIKNNRGQALVEFALILPVLLLLAVGVMEFGLILNQYMVVAESSREGARSAALGGDDVAVTAAAEAAAASIDKGGLQVTITPAGSRIRGNPVTVTVANPVSTITQLMDAFFPAGFAVTGTTIMRVE